MAFGAGSIGSAYGQIIIETNRAVANIRTLRGNLDNFAQQTQSVGFGLATLARSVTAFGALLAAAPLAGLKFFADFEEQMRNVASISPEMAANLQSASAAVLDLSAETGRSATELASALYDIAQSGYQGADALNILGAAANFANAGMSSAKVGAEAIVGVLNSGIKSYTGEALTANRISDILFQTVFRGVITADELGQQIGDNLALASSLGVSLEEVGAAYVVLTKQKVLPAEAATQINAIMNALLKPTEELQGILESQNFQSGYELLTKGFEGETGFRGAIKFFDRLLDGDFGKLEDISGNIRAMRGVIGLLAGDESMQMWNEEFESVLNDSVGATDRAIKEQEKGLKYIGRQFKETLKAMLIEGVEPIVPAIKSLLKGGTALINWFRDLGSNVKNFISLLLPIGAAVYAFAGVILTLLARLYSIRTGLAYLGLGLTTVLGPLGLLTIGLTTLATMLLNNTNGIADLAKGLLEILDILKLFGTARLGDNFTNGVVEAYTRLEDLLDGPLGHKRAMRIIKALQDVQPATRRLVKQFQRIGQVAENFWNIINGDADNAEFGRFQERLNALFGKQLGGRLSQGVLKFRDSIRNLRQGLEDTFGINPWQTNFTNWLTDGIRRWGDLATFIRQEVIPTMGRRFESAIVLATNALTALTAKLPEIKFAFQGIRTLAGNMLDAFLEGDFDRVAWNFQKILDVLSEIVGKDIRGLAVAFRIDTVNFINNAASNVGDFINDVLTGAGFTTGGEEDTVGYKIGTVALSVGRWAVEGAGDLLQKLKQETYKLLGLTGGGSRGDSEDNIGGASVIIPAVGVTIQHWIVTAAESLFDAVTEFVNGVAGTAGAQAGGTGIHSQAGPTDLEGNTAGQSGFAHIGSITIDILKWAITSADSIIGRVEKYWNAHKGDLKEKVFEIPEIVGQILKFSIELGSDTVSLGDTIERYLAIAAVGFALAPIGIPLVAVQILAFLVGFLPTGLSDAVDFIIQTLTAAGLTADEINDFPAKIGSIAWHFLTDIGSDFARELRESAILIEAFTGWELSLGVPENGIDASAVVAGIFTAIGDVLARAIGELASVGTFNEIGEAGEAVGGAIVELLAGSVASIFAVSDIASQFPEAAASITAAALAFIGGIVTGMVEAIRDNFAAEVESRLPQDASGMDFAKAVGGALLEWAINALEVGFAIINIAGLGLPNLAKTLITKIADGLSSAFRGEDISLSAPPGKMGIKGLDGEDIVIHQESLADSILASISDAIGNIFDGPIDFVSDFISDFDSFIVDPIVEHIQGIGSKIGDAFNAMFGGGGEVSTVFASTGRGGPAAGAPTGGGGMWGLKDALQGVLDLIEDFSGIDIPSIDAITGAFDAMWSVINKITGPLGEAYNFVTGIFGAVGDQQIEPVDPNNPPQPTGEPDPESAPNDNVPNRVGSADDNGRGAASAIKLADAARGARDALKLLGGQQDATNRLIGTFREQIGLTDTPLERMRQSIGDRGVAALTSFATRVQDTGTRLGTSFGPVLTTMRDQVTRFSDHLRATGPLIGTSLNPALDGLREKVAGVGPAFAAAAASVETGFRERVVTALQEAKENGNLQMAAMILRASAFGDEMGIQGARAGDSFKFGLAFSLLGAIGTVMGALESIRGVVSGFDLYNQGYFIGSSLGLGIARGLNDQTGAVAAAAANLVFAANAAQIQAGVIKSPSELMRKTVGRPLGMGTVLGLLDTIPAMTDASQDLVYAALSHANGAISNGMGGAVYGQGPSAPVIVHVEPKINELDDVRSIIEFFRGLPAQMATV